MRVAGSCSHHASLAVVKTRWLYRPAVMAAKVARRPGEAVGAGAEREVSRGIGRPPLSCCSTVSSWRGFRSVARRLTTTNGEGSCVRPPLESCSRRLSAGCVVQVLGFATPLNGHFVDSTHTGR